MLVKQKKVDPQFPKEGYDPVYFGKKYKSLDAKGNYGELLRSTINMWYAILPLSILIIYGGLIIIYIIYIALVIIYSIFNKGMVWNNYLEFDLIHSVVMSILLIFIICCIMCSVGSLMFFLARNKSPGFVYWFFSIIAYIPLLINLVIHIVNTFYYVFQFKNGLLPRGIWVAIFILNLIYSIAGLLSTAVVIILVIIVIYPMLKKAKQAKDYTKMEEGEEKNYASANLDIQKTIVNMCTKEMGYNPFNEDVDVFEKGGQNISITENIYYKKE
jgi:hypothetical protein